MNNMDRLPLPGGASGPARNAIIQIHPSLRCNLACAHCYSSSGPTTRVELDPAIICEVISDAATMGYKVVSVSGGEPLMYRGLTEVLSHAKSLGLQTTVTTNGFFNKQKQLDSLRRLVDLLAISLDGPPAIHNEIRGNLHAFKRLEAGLDAVRNSDIPFGFIHTLTQPNWEHLLWVAEFAVANGARLLQIHPLELTGRAQNEMRDEAPEEDVLAKVYLLAAALAGKYADTMTVQLDLLYREHLRQEPELVYAGKLDDKVDQIAPAQLLGLIVLEPDGSLVPVSYGFSRSYKICNVKEEKLAHAWPGHLANGYPAFRDLCRFVWEKVCSDDAPLLSNWHEIIVAQSLAANTIEIAEHNGAVGLVPTTEQ